MAKIIGVISDTHGLLRKEALGVLRGCELIVHAGDIGDAAVLDGLRTMAPVTAVRGNMDRGGWTRGLRAIERVDWQGVKLLVIHNVHELEGRPEELGVNVVIYGHSHQPKIEYRGDVLFFNPGIAGPKRFRRPISAGKLTWDGGSLRPEIVTLADDFQVGNGS